MLHRSTIARVALPLMTLALTALTGCGGGGSKESVIVHKPDWAFEKYKRIAVLPTKCSDPRAKSHGDHLTARLTEMLANNGAFSVVEKERFRDVMTEQDLSKLADVTNPDTALPEGAIEVAQVLVLPAITTYDLKATKAERRQPVYQYDRRGMVLRDRAGRPLVAGERVSTEFTHGARVSGTVRVVDAATGRTLMSHSVTNVGDETSHWNSPPDESPEDIATKAVDEMATEFYKHIAPTRMEVEFSSDNLLVALDYFDGKYETISKVPWNAEKILAVARDLPPACNRNDFRLEVFTAASKDSIASQEFTWSPSTGKRGVALEVAIAKLKNSGEVEFVAKLYSAGDDEPVLTKKFSLEVPKEEADKRRKREE